MINDLNLNELVAQGETETVEFKKSTGLLREGIETICAFANHRGGYLIFGVTDHGDPVGQEISDDTLKNLANAIKLNTDPKLYPVIEKRQLAGKHCIVVTVEESPLKPHLAYGRPYMRVGATNQQLDRDRYAAMLQQRLNGYGFDHLICPNATVKDIDSTFVYEFLETANAVREINENLYLPLEIIMRKLDLLRDNGLTNAAMLLFGNQPERFYAGRYEVKCGWFEDNDSYDRTFNDQEFSGNLIKTFRSALGFVMESVTKRSQKNDVHRCETYEFPVAILREAIVNTIVHRDYRQNIKSTIEIRPSKVIFYNPAQLFAPTITIERLKKHHPSRPGNRLIAKVFYMMGLFENWGSGTLKIVSGALQVSKPEPAFFFEDGMFRLELYR